MGREAQCRCQWGDRFGHVKALLESSDLLVRGDIRASAARDSLEDVNVRGDNLEFFAAGEKVVLELGAMNARRWAATIAAPLPSLAHKLGITSTTRLHLTGQIDDDALAAAIADAAALERELPNADLAIIRTDDRAALHRWAGTLGSEQPPPAWIVYVKGARAPLGETTIREVMRQLGFIDTKVARVSERLAALRFIKKTIAVRNANRP